MRERRGVIGVVVTAAVAAALVLPAAAEATTFCVPNTLFAGCPGGATPVADLEAAANNVATASDGIPDQVLVQPGTTYTDSASFEVAVGTDDLLIDGGDPSTEITTALNMNILVANLAMNGNARDVTLEDLSIVMPALLPDGLGAGLQMSSDTLQNVHFISENPNTDAIASILGGATIHGGSYGGRDGGSIGSAIRVGNSANAAVDIEDVTIDANTGIGVNDGTATVDVDRSRIRSSVAGIDTARGTVNVRNSIFETTSNAALNAFSNSSSNVTINAEGVTMVDSNPGNTVPIYAATQAAATGTATINLDSSIARGYQNGWTRSAAGAAASIAIDHSNINDIGFDFGPGGPTTRTNSIFADPLFTNEAGGVYTLTAASPSIDAGDPASTLVEDFALDPRPLDGDGNGSEIVDQGAFERATPPDTTPPNTIIDSGPAQGSTVTQNKATFAFHGNPAGDTAKIQCKLDGAAFADCTSPKTFAGLADGTHTVRFRAEDALGNQDTTPATRTFTVDTTPPPDTTPPNTTITSGPGAKAKKGKPKFEFNSSESNSSFECSLVKKGKPAAFSDCSSPQSYVIKRRKKTRRYVFSVRATDQAQNTDATPATAKFKVKRKR